MITIVITILLATLLYKRNLVWACIVCSIGLIVLLLPVQGYQNYELTEQVELLPLSQKADLENGVYVAASQKGIYAYRYIDEDTSNVGKINTISRYRTVVEINPLKQGEKPTMYKYVSKPKRLWFTLAINAEKTKYVFYVPNAGG